MPRKHFTNPRRVIARRIAVARRHVGQSQTAFAMSLGTSSSHVEKLESGKTQPSARYLLKIRDHTGASIDWLFGYGPDDFTPAPTQVPMIELEKHLAHHIASEVARAVAAQEIPELGNLSDTWQAEGSGTLKADFEHLMETGRLPASFRAPQARTTGRELYFVVENEPWKVDGARILENAVANEREALRRWVKYAHQWSRLKLMATVSLRGLEVLASPYAAERHHSPITEAFDEMGQAILGVHAIADALKRVEKPAVEPPLTMAFGTRTASATPPAIVKALRKTLEAQKDTPDA